MAAGNLDLSSLNDEGGSSSDDGAGSSDGNSQQANDNQDLIERFGIGSTEDVIYSHLPEVSCMDTKQSATKFASVDSDDEDDGSSDDLIEELNYGQENYYYRSSFGSECSTNDSPKIDLLDITTDIIEEIEDDNHGLFY